MASTEHLKSVSARIGKDRYKTEITLPNHTVIADEPPALGGEDLGPSPGDFLRMSLASCTAITLRMYADRKGYDVPEIEVNVSSDEVDGKTVFQCSIRVAGQLDDAVRKRMLQIANACPIHKTLAGPIEIISNLEQ